MQNCKSAATPLPARYMLESVSPDMAINPELQRCYQMIIGSLLYLMIGTRPDIAFAVIKLAQFTACPSEEHFNKALYICHYLRGTSKTILLMMVLQVKVSLDALTLIGHLIPTTNDPKQDTS